MIPPSFDKKSLAVQETQKGKGTRVEKREGRRAASIIRSSGRFTLVSTSLFAPERRADK